MLGCFVIGCKSGIPRLFCNQCETSYLMERDSWFLLGEIFFSLLLLLPVDVFVYLFPYACILAPPPPFQKQPSTRRCAPCYELRDPFLTRNASFEIYNPRRSWHIMTPSKTRRVPGHLSPFVVRSEDPGETMAVLNAWRK